MRIAYLLLFLLLSVQAIPSNLSGLKLNLTRNKMALGKRTIPNGSNSSFYNSYTYLFYKWYLGVDTENVKLK